MKIVLILITILMFSSCKFPPAGLNKFSKIHKGMDIKDVIRHTEVRPEHSQSIQFYNEPYFFEVYHIKLSTYVEEREERRPSYINNRAQDIYRVTTTNDYFYPYIILYKDNLVYFQGFIWEFINNDQPEINEYGLLIRKYVNVN